MKKISLALLLSLFALITSANAELSPDVQATPTIRVEIATPPPATTDIEQKIESAERTLAKEKEIENLLQDLKNRSAEQEETSRQLEETAKQLREAVNKVSLDNTRLEIETRNADRWLVLFGIIAAVAGIGFPMITTQRVEDARQQALASANSAKEIEQEVKDRLGNAQGMMEIINDLAQQAINTQQTQADLLYEKRDIYSLNQSIGLYRKILDANEKMFGEEHPDTLTSMNNLAFLLKNRGDKKSRDEAEKLYTEALRLRKKILGDEHPDTLTSMNNLANLLSDKGDAQSRDEAKQLYEEALKNAKKNLGEEHPITKTIEENLAQLLDDESKE